MSIKLEHGKVFVNKTLKYFKPIFWAKYRNRYLDSIFKNRVKFAAYGLGDFLLSESYDNHLFVLIDVLKTGSHMNIALDMVRDLPFYETDYIFDIIDGYHMIVFNIPDELKDSFNEFKNSRYSRMGYSKNLSAIYDNKRPYWKEATSVIKKESTAKDLYISRIKSYYGVDDDIINTIDIDEYDFPIDHKEYFNSHLMTNERKKI